MSFFCWCFGLVSSGVIAVMSSHKVGSMALAAASAMGQLSVNATLLDTKSRRILGEVVVTQPEWDKINLRRSFAYTTDQVERARLVSNMLNLFSWCFLNSQSTYFQSPSEAKVASRGERRRSTAKLPDWESPDQAQLCKFTFLAPPSPLGCWWRV